MRRFRSKVVAEDCVEFAINNLGVIHQLADQLRASGRFEDVVPGLEVLTIRFHPEQVDIAEIEARLDEAVLRDPDSSVTPEVMEIHVRYGGTEGPDLSDICHRLGVGETELIASHTDGLYPVEIIGFTPGFAYLGGLPAHLSVPRRSTPRPRLPAGSIGLAGSHTGIYALDGPGGWSIIGRTNHKLFDPARPDPFLIRPGMSVRFVAI